VLAAWHPNIDEAMENRKHKRMVGNVLILLTGTAWGTLLLLSASAQVSSDPSSQNPPSNSAPPSSQKEKPKQGANPFPEDTNSVPVLPSANSPASAEPSGDSSTYGDVTLPHAENDPVLSPDDSTPLGEASSTSSSSEGMDNLLKPPPDEEGSKHRKLEAPEHTENAKEDESVGSYYLDQKNWKAALSRFESALVLDPENPDVYWGLAESQRHTGDYVSAKANYLKVMEYDPESRHGKDAKRILKEPEMESAKAVPASAPAQQPQH
jgi:tetratricopeptide (TPR) repeat protein